jgi:hypothetical protein
VVFVDELNKGRFRGVVKFACRFFTARILRRAN